MYRGYKFFSLIQQMDFLLDWKSTNYLRKVHFFMYKLKWLQLGPILRILQSSQWIMPILSDIPDVTVLLIQRKNANALLCPSTCFDDSFYWDEIEVLNTCDFTFMRQFVSKYHHFCCIKKNQITLIRNDRYLICHRRKMQLAGFCWYLFTPFAENLPFSNLNQHMLLWNGLSIHVDNSSHKHLQLLVFERCAFNLFRTEN